MTRYVKTLEDVRKGLWDVTAPPRDVLEEMDKLTKRFDDDEA